MSRWLEIDINTFKNISTKGPFGWWSVLMGPDVFVWLKGMSAKLLVRFFDAVQMQMIWKILLIIIGVKITNLYSIFYSKWNFLVENIFLFICIFMAAKNYTSNFADTLFGHDLTHLQISSLTSTSIRPPP